MKQSFYLIAVLISLAGLQACSEKAVNTPPAVMGTAPATAPAAALPATAAITRPAEAPALPMERLATLQCEDRKIVLEAACMSIDGARLLSCTRQVLTVTDSGSGKKLTTREFAHGKVEGSDPGFVEEMFGEISCVTTKSNEKFIVATMDNGGNCDECEWVDVYSWDGALLGSERVKREKPKGIDEALDAAFDQKNPPKAKMEFSGFYYLPMKD